MKADFKGFKISFLFSIFFIGMLFPSASFIAAQGDPATDDVAPPSLRILSKEEKKQLESEKSNVKKRTKISLELMEARLLRAESKNVETQYKQTLDELAGFHAILDNTLDYLIGADADDRRFITFEIYLRKQIPRLEAMRRTMPFRYGYHVGSLMKALRDAREKAVEPIFDDTVVPTAVRKPNQ